MKINLLIKIVKFYLKINLTHLHLSNLNIDLLFNKNKENKILIKINLESTRVKAQQTLHHGSTCYIIKIIFLYN